MKKRWKKRVVSYVIVATMLTATVLPVGNPGMKVQATEYPGITEIARQTAEEGIVLLENKDHVLPIQSKEVISVFGRTQVDSFYCGYGSGGYVYPSNKISILDGLRKNGDIRLNEELAQDYEKWCEENPVDDNNDSWGKWPYYYPERVMDESIVKKAAQESDKAVVVIGRSAGEDRECKLESGSYYLTEEEKRMLSQVNEYFEDVIVVLNIGNIIDMSWVQQYSNIKGILNVWQGGMEMGKAVAKVLSGEVSPSGKLTSTIAKNYDDYPSSENFGAKEFNEYKEDIYVGYRYFETFADKKDKVMYPFGYGLSYTDFEIETGKITNNGSTIRVPVEVTNTGDTEGKEVVQIYYGAPQGKLGKAAKSLAAYAKTPSILPGETKELTISFKIDSMASYDDSGVTGHKSAYVLEEGEYPIYVGDSVRDAQVEGIYEQTELEVIEQLEEALAPVKEFERIKAQEGENGELVETSETVSTSTINLKERIDHHLPQEIEPTEDQGYKLLDVYQGKRTMEEFIAQLSDEELARITRGAGPMQSSLGTPGNAGVFGGVEKSIRDRGVVPVSAHDGPSGLRLQQNVDKSSLLPIGSLLACTWNTELVEYLYQLMSREMTKNKVDVLLAPGMNLQRNPLGGRNFEYFSEDPLVTGTMGAAVVRGIQSEGNAACMKHFAANNQETNRKHTDSVVSERALREIYLKGFEIAVKTADPYTMMSGYNKLNGIYCCYNYDLMTTILRNEWEYQGMLMTDWSMVGDSAPYNPNVKDQAYRIQAQLDLFMPGQGWDDSSTLNALGNGLTRGELQRSVKNILNYVMISPKFARENGLEPKKYEKPASYFEVEGGIQIDGESGRISKIFIDGKELTNFNPLVQEYEVFHRESAQLPKVTVEKESDEIQVDIEQATEQNKKATIRVTEGEIENIYVVHFIYEMDMNPSVKDPVFAYLKNIKVDGKDLPGFYSTLYEYELATDHIPEITVDVSEGVNVTITDSQDKTYTEILAESDDHAVLYTITYTQPVEGPKSDEFEGNEISDIWTQNNRNEKAEQKDGCFVIHTEGGDLYEEKTGLHNYLAQPAKGDWESVTKISLDEMPSELYHQAGIMIMEDEDNYLYFRLEKANEAGKMSVRLNQEKNADSKEIANNKELPDLIKDNAFYLKVIKEGGQYKFLFSLDGEEFVQIGVISGVSYENPQFVLTASNGDLNSNISSLEVKFDYVRFTEKEPEKEKTVLVKSRESSRVKAAEDYYSITSGLIVEDSKDEDGGKSLGMASNGQYVLYKVEVEETGYYQISPRIASARDSLYQLSFGLEDGGRPLVSFMQLGGTGGWNSWITMEPKTVYLEEGMHRLKLYYLSDGININWLQFDRVNEYQIHAEEKEGAKIVLKQTAAIPGENVSFTILEDENYEVVDVMVMGQNGEITVQQKVDGSYYFEMPQSDVKIQVETKVKQSEDLRPAILEYMIQIAKEAEEEGQLENVIPVVKEKFETALFNAEDILKKVKEGKEGITQVQIDMATKELLSALQYLEFKGDKKDLLIVVDLAETYLSKKDEYIASTFAPFEETLNAAKEVVDNENALQEEIDTVWKALLKAMAELRLKPDKSLLEEFLIKAQGIDFSLYTKVSAQKVRAAIADAKVIYESEECDQETVDQAVEKLKIALNSLEEQNATASPKGDTESMKQNSITGSENNGKTEETVLKSVEEKSAKTGDEESVFPYGAGMLAAAVVLILTKNRKNYKR